MEQYETIRVALGQSADCAGPAVLAAKNALETLIALGELPPLYYYWVTRGIHATFVRNTCVRSILSVTRINDEVTDPTTGPAQLNNVSH